MNLIQSLKSYLHLQRDINVFTKDTIEKSINSLYYKLKVDDLTNKTLFSHEKGICDKSIGDEDVIVSLTTFGMRLYEVYLAIESIMQGTVKPNKIILWISESYQAEEIPQTLQLQQKRGLEIEFCKDIRSYTKLIPALRKYPQATIVTIDDDIIYPIDMLENLLRAHKRYEGCVCANRVHLLPYNWGERYIPLNRCEMYAGVIKASHLFLAEGYAGALYPPNIFDDEMLKEDVFLDICKYADDVWFKAMELKNKIPVVYANRNRQIEEFLVNPKVQKVALKNINNGEQQMNDIQIKAVFDRYGLFEVMKTLT